MTIEIKQRSADRWKVYQHGIFSGEIDESMTFTPSSSSPPNLTLSDLQTLARFIRRRQRRHQ